MIHGPGGGHYRNEGTFVEIVPPERIVIRHLSAPHFLLTATFADQAGTTRLTWHMLFESPAEREKVARFAVDADEQNLDRLEAHLATLA